MDWLNPLTTLIVGGIGFAGVIYTLRHNAKTARIQRNEEREHEREALRAALLAELQINRQSLQENSRKLRENPSEETGGAYVPTDRMDGAYQSFLPRIGLLSKGEVHKVMWAYLSLQQYNADLLLMGEPAHKSPRHVMVSGKRSLQLLAAKQQGMLEPIDQAIKALEEAAH